MTYALNVTLFLKFLIKNEKILKYNEKHRGKQKAEAKLCFIFDLNIGKYLFFFKRLKIYISPKFPLTRERINKLWYWFMVKFLNE